MAPGLRGTRGGHLALGMKGALSTDGTDEKRRLPPRAEDLGAEIGLGHIDEAARLQADMPERLDIRLQRQVVIDAAGHVAPMRGRKGAPRSLLEVHHLQRVFGAAEHRRIIRDGNLLRPRANRRREHGTRGEEVKQFPAAGIHDPSPAKRDLHVDPVGVLDVQTGIGVVFGARTTLCHIAGSGVLGETGYPNREVIDNAGGALMVERDQRPGGTEANNSERLVLAKLRRGKIRDRATWSWRGF